jgi:hypothetical protein
MEIQVICLLTKLHPWWRMAIAQALKRELCNADNEVKIIGTRHGKAIQTLCTHVKKWSTEDG